MRAVDMGGRLNSCEDFRALADAYREGTLSEARHMLVEDHLHSCVACRRFFRGEQKASVVTMPREALDGGRGAAMGDCGGGVAGCGIDAA